MSGEEASLHNGLVGGLAQLQLELNDRQIGQLLSYQALIAKWTKVYNLTAVRDPAEMMTHHLLDSLAAIAPLQKQMTQGKLLDVGSGAGLPGVVIAICCPAIGVTCVDTVAKKATFIKQVALELKLPNLAGLHARVENIDQPFDVICSRAFASLNDFTQWSSKALASSGLWMAMKGKHPADELAALAADIDVFHVEQLQVPGLDAERCVVWLRKKSVS
jgi:16S rRNA (guanine527-N7)-methyltransferase